jgi:hypothetical protein
MRDLVFGDGYFRPTSAQPHMIPSWRNTSAEVAVQTPLSAQVCLGGGMQVRKSSPPCPNVAPSGKAFAQA